MMKRHALPLVFVGFGLFMLVAGFWSLPEQIVSKDWPSVRGMMLASEILKHSSRKQGSDYTLKLSYEYRVGEKTYQGTRQAATRHEYELRMEATEALQRYAVGMPVEVFYNPKDPAKALLEPGLRFKNFLLIFFGFAFWAGAILFWIYSKGAKG